MTEPRPDDRAVRLELADTVATITFDAPHRGNRFTVATMLALITALERASGQAVVLVLRATGPDFSFGRDSSERIPGLSNVEALRLITSVNALLRNFTGVSIAVVQGHALGFGAGLALQSDITLATEDAVLGFDEILHGLAPLVVVDYLRSYVGPKLATELVVTGRLLTAIEAQRVGMVNRIVPTRSLASEADALVDHLRRRPAGALRLLKRFTHDTVAGAVTDPGEEAITRLDNWLSAGRPDVPPAPAAVLAMP
ncbi:enoyl-CoA hydratase/isomerase family protein [Mycobacterium intracellulare]|uniref:enoyl-CoA hydratase/isomerase family protein n=1 Tax=Mycobacterium intracellulare TaxID=1767 RepID=UPI001EEE5C7F|nr:enoyl-CoA hydratase/isomerase family protein [Mycobacterium intracellulare]MEE3750857.1 enoyl-CoA hydratase/isomerase family protein [Mycobacterium intracellulare]